jgi:hypothetical protein
MTHQLTRAAHIFAAALLAAFALNAAAEPSDGQFAIESLNTPYPEFVATGNSVNVRIRGPSTASLLHSSVRLNGQDVTSLFALDSAPGSISGSISGLQTGVNVIALYPSKHSDEELARLTVSTAMAPALNCVSLTSLSIPPALLESPTDVVLIDSATTQAANNALPAHCRLQGRINPRIGVNNTPFAIGFELLLPAAWSGRFFFQGGGGNDGAGNLTGLANTGGNPRNGGPPPLARGFAAVTTDGGHTGSLASSFGFDPQARIDHAYNAFGKTAATAKAIIDLYYGKGPDKSYFAGCSGGGRQGMMFTQRYPTYFNGVFAEASAMRVATGASTSAAWESITYNSIAPKDAIGNPILSQAFSDADLALVSNAVLKACDGLDGAVDGSINNVLACQFDPAVLQCSGAKNATCLASAQVAALKKGFGAPFNSAGKPLYTTWPFDAGISGPNWRAWKLGTSPTATPNSLFVTLIQDAMANEFFTPPDPTFSIFTYNFDTDPARQAAEGMIYDTWPDAKLSAFHARGGKILFAHGVSDPIFSADEDIQYYERLAAANRGLQQTGSWARLFLVPGMNHCNGGPATDTYDELSKLIDWVENDNAPERIIASGNTFPGRTRPLCPYPSYARYTGQGSVDDASNFTCRRSDIEEEGENGEND